MHWFGVELNFFICVLTFTIAGKTFTEPRAEKERETQEEG